MTETKKRFLVYATVTLTGACMEVEAADAKEAEEIACRELDFDLATSEMTDWKVTDVREDAT